MSLLRVACVVGPTASGKSDVAELVALTLDGEIVSVDSMQVYRGMDIGTAKIPLSQRRVPLHMVDVVNLGDSYSVAQFQKDARSCVEDVARCNHVPILCGGTGLYLDAIIDELKFPVGEVEGDRRRSYEDLAQEIGAESLHALLESRDPESARLIHAHNVRRVIRALELCDEGKSYAQRNEGLKRHLPHYEACIWALTLPREDLYARIDSRVDAMFAAGLVEEVRSLDSQGIRESVTASQAIGYKEVLGLLDGTYDEEEAIRLVKRNTRRYAKRQLSWIRRDGRARELDVSAIGLEGAARTIAKEWIGG